MLRHLSHYLIIFFIFLIVFLSRLLLGFNQNLLMEIFYLATLFYVGWGIMHHFLEHDFSLKVVIEYILIGAVALLLGIIAIKGGL